MLRKLKVRDVNQVTKIHYEELPGFLSTLGEKFLNKFYKASLDIPEFATYVEEENEHILGFVSIAETTNGLLNKVIFTDLLGFTVLFLSYFIVHFYDIPKVLKILAYPGFEGDTPELLTISIGKDYQRRGIGKRLFKKASDEFRKKGIREFKISVYDRLQANSFYIKMGCKLEKSFYFLGEKMNYYSYIIK